MKSTITVLMWMGVLASVCAQVVTTEHRLHLGFTNVSMRDSYLSSMPYEGVGMSFAHAASRPVSPENVRDLWLYGAALHLGVAQNPAGSAGMQSIVGEIRGGYVRVFPLRRGLWIEPGLQLQMNAGARNIARNVNNPANMVLSMDVRPNVRILFDRNGLKLRMEVSSPLVGLMFVPDYGIGYYEMVSLSNWNRAFHLSSLHNRQGITGRIDMDFTVFDRDYYVGFYHQAIQYKANNLFFSDKQRGLVFGMRFESLRLKPANRNQIPSVKPY